MSAAPIFETVSVEEMVTAQFYGIFSINVRSYLNKRVALPFGDNENRIL